MATIASDLLRTQAYVDGRWSDAESGETFPVVDPATGDTVATVPRLGLTETRSAIEAGVRHFIFASSVKVNGETTPPGHPFRESDAPHPLDGYGASKWAAERVLGPVV